jgi:single-strand DNA-binding protein
VALAVAASPPPVASGDRQEMLPQVSGTGNEGDQTMNETQLTITGNLVDDPELRFTPSGQPVAKFRIASTPRFYDKQAGEWRDGESLFLTVNVWRQAAENVAESLTRGSRAIVTGRLRQRSYETNQGEKRTVYEVEADDVAASLKNASVKITKTARAKAGNGSDDQAAPWTAERSGGYTDEPPF